MPTKEEKQQIINNIKKLTIMIFVGTHSEVMFFAVYGYLWKPFMKDRFLEMIKKCENILLEEEE